MVLHDLIERQMRPLTQARKTGYHAHYMSKVNNVTRVRASRGRPPLNEDRLAQYAADERVSDGMRRLARAASARQLTPAMLARISGIDPSALSRAFEEPRNPATAIRRIAKALGYPAPVSRALNNELSTNHALGLVRGAILGLRPALSRETDCEVYWQSALLERADALPSETVRLVGQRVLFVTYGLDELPGPSWRPLHQLFAEVFADVFADLGPPAEEKATEHDAQTESWTVKNSLERLRVPRVIQYGIYEILRPYGFKLTTNDDFEPTEEEDIDDHLDDETSSARRCGKIKQLFQNTAEAYRLLPAEIKPASSELVLRVLQILNDQPHTRETLDIVTEILESAPDDRTPALRKLRSARSAVISNIAALGHREAESAS